MWKFQRHEEKNATFQYRWLLNRDDRKGKFDLFSCKVSNVRSKNFISTHHNIIDKWGLSHVFGSFVSNKYVDMFTGVVANTSTLFIIIDRMTYVVVSNPPTFLLLVVYYGFQPIDIHSLLTEWRTLWFPTLQHSYYWSYTMVSNPSTFFHYWPNDVHCGFQPSNILIIDRILWSPTHWYSFIIDRMTYVLVSSLPTFLLLTVCHQYSFIIDRVLILDMRI
jgi:hypothetical protein